MQPGKPSCAWVNLCARSAGQAPYLVLPRIVRNVEYSLSQSIARASLGRSKSCLAEFDVWGSEWCVLTPTFFGRTGRLRCFPHVPRTYHEGSGVVRADKAGEAFTRQAARWHGDEFAGSCKFITDRDSLGEAAGLTTQEGGVREDRSARAL